MEVKDWFFDETVFLENKIEVTLLSNKNEQQRHLVHLSGKVWLGVEHILSLHEIYAFLFHLE